MHISFFSKQPLAAKGQALGKDARETRRSQAKTSESQRETRTGGTSKSARKKVALFLSG